MDCWGAAHGGGGCRICCFDVVRNFDGCLVGFLFSNLVFLYILGSLSWCLSFRLLNNQESIIL